MKSDTPVWCWVTNWGILSDKYEWSISSVLQQLYLSVHVLKGHRGWWMVPVAWRLEGDFSSLERGSVVEDSFWLRKEAWWSDIKGKGSGLSHGRKKKNIYSTSVRTVLEKWTMRDDLEAQNGYEEGLGKEEMEVWMMDKVRGGLAGSTMSTVGCKFERPERLQATEELV